ncbi:hypothetical protein OJ998_05105 [Solirubrobacter taibaiensis]|nr:hypothetical protein [Solirubrobacter taibaiensis]
MADHRFERRAGEPHEEAEPYAGALPDTEVPSPRQQVHPTQLLAMQRSAGNQAVSRLLARQTTRPGTPPPRRWRAPQADAQLVERLMSDRSPIWQQIDPSGEGPNCPATAAAVDHYLATGEVEPVEAAHATEVYTFDRRPVTRARNWAEIQTVAARQNSHVTVIGLREPGWARRHQLTDQHFFHVVRRAGALVVLDASGGQSAPHAVADVAAFIRENGFVRFEYYAAELRVRRRDTTRELDGDAVNDAAGAP